LHYILIDYENVQPADLAGLEAQEACVLVFMGAQQKVGSSLIEAVQALGERGRFIRIAGNGPNALDFHIAYYLGQWTMRDPQATFLIVSKDTGFDPLIAHLSGIGTQVKRLCVESSAKQVAKKAAPPARKTAKKVAAEPAKKAAKTAIIQPAVKKAKALKITVEPLPASKPAQAVASTGAAAVDADRVVKRLQDMPNNLPGTEASLRRMMGTWLSKDAKRLDAAVAELKRRATIALTGTKVAYKLAKA
jgi:hypothetical protein